MKKIDKVVIRETVYIAVWTLILSVAMQAVFLVIGKWDYTVLLGNLLSGVASVLNFFAMGITVQKSLTKNEKDAKQQIKASSTVRLLCLAVVAGVGVLLDCFHFLTVLIPLFFPRIAVMIRPLFEKKKKETEVEARANEGNDES